MAATTPPVTRTAAQSLSSLLMMGFPSRTLGKHQSFCACHSKLHKGGYECSRCETKVCSLPAECPACGLTLILSTHLARSYHHLYPLENFVEVPWSEAGKSLACFACQTLFPTPPEKAGGDNTAEQLMVSESGRYSCKSCKNHFCIDCDVFSHEIIHNCPGCQSRAQKTPLVEGNSNGNGDAMTID